MDRGTMVWSQRWRAGRGPMAVLAGIGAAFLVLGLISGQFGAALLIGGLSLLISGAVLLSAPPFRGKGQACRCGVDRAARR